jgi:ABC-type nitrate/sulfonate/bicarbonate transport system substrate-binding protein
VSARSAHKSAPTVSALRVGFVPLIDAAPLIAAREMGHFADERVDVSLHRQIGWGNVRDKLTFGHLHASHALLGMAPLSVLGTEQFVEPLVAIAGLSAGGNAIALSRRLVAMGVTSPDALARLVRQRQGKPLVFAHVFSCSTHHYLLRDWLGSAGIDPDADVHLCVLPPPQMVRQMAEGFLDGFCVGEPWAAVAAHEQHGATVAATTILVPDHPEKVLAVSRHWLSANRSAAERMVRAVLRGCAFCADPAHAIELARMLSLPRYLDVPQSLLESTLAVAVGFRSWTAATTFPSATHAAWLLDLMRKWGHVPAAEDLIAVARESADAQPYRAAAASLGWSWPPSDFPPMRLRDGWFDPCNTAAPGCVRPKVEIISASGRKTAGGGCPT